MRKFVYFVHVSLDGHIEGPNGEFDWRETPKIVFSRTLDKADWNTEVIGGDLADLVAELKSRPGKDLLLMGGARTDLRLTSTRTYDEHAVLLTYEAV